MERFCSHLMEFHKIYEDFLKKNCQVNSISITISKQQEALFMQTNILVWSYLCQFFLEWKMLQTLVEKIETHIFVQKCCFLNHDAYEIMWKNDEGLDRPQMTIWHMCIACWIIKATDTCSLYVITCFNFWRGHPLCWV